jgi:large subunit ribosomal protein L13
MLPKNKLRDRRLERLKIFPSHNMGKVGANILRNWDDGTLPPDFDPSRPTTALTLRRLKGQREGTSVDITSFP